MTVIRHFLLSLWVAAAWCAGQPPALAAPAHASVEDAGGGHDSHAKGGPNPLAVDPDLAIWTMIVFLVLLAVLWKFAWGPISAGLDRREEGVAAHIAAAERTHEQAKDLLADYERKLAAAADTTRQMLEEARRDAEQTKQDIIAEAKVAAQAEHDRAMREIRTATDQALSEISEKSANLAVDLAGKIVRTQLTKADHARLVQDAMSALTAGSPSVN